MPVRTASSRPPLGPQCADDVVIALALTTKWMMITGRRLEFDVPLFHDLPEAELVDFWADDHIAALTTTLAGMRHEPPQARLSAA